MPISIGAAILISAGLATVGWGYTARRHRILSRKQHTFNSLLKTSFSEQYNTALGALANHLRRRRGVALGNRRLIPHLRVLLNHYEFLAAGVRFGDIDEQLLKNTERGLMVAAVKCGERWIFSRRDAPERMALYEHLVWLKGRWTTEPPGRFQRAVEFIKGSPLRGRLDRIDER